MRKPAIITVASLGLLSLAGSAAWACDWDEGHGYRQSRVYGYSYAPRTYGYYAPAYGYHTAFVDDYDYDYDYGYGYGGLAVGFDVARDRRIHRRHVARTAVNVDAREARVREGAIRTSAGREGSAMRGAGSGEGGRGAAGPAAGMRGGMGGGGMGRGGDGGGRR
jgi:hypothetical protein